MSEAEVAGLLAEDLSANVGVLLGMTLLVLGAMVIYLLKMASITSHKLSYLLRMIAGQPPETGRRVTYQRKPEILEGLSKQGRKKVTQSRAVL